jgi:hypothetical protein
LRQWRLLYYRNGCRWCLDQKFYWVREHPRRLITGSHPHFTPANGLDGEPLSLTPMFYKIM